jgi:membrane protein, putative (traD/traG family)
LALGEKEVEKETKSSNGKNESSSISIIKEPVMSVSDLKYKNPDMTIITSGGNKPIALKLKPAYDYFDYPNYIHVAEKIVLDTSVI